MSKQRPLSPPFPHQEGQALVLIAMAIIGLIAFTALAVDGSMSYSQRRAAQNASDGAAIAGGYKIRLQNRNLGGTALQNQRDLLVVMNKAAQAHGLPDTNNDPNDHINDNVEAYYTDSRGRVDTSCRIGSCTSVPNGSWGVHVVVRKPFETFFAGIVGWRNATVGANAIAVVHAGAMGNNNKYWAIFGDIRHTAGNYAGDVSGSTTEIVGNIHSNGSFKMTGARAIADGQITYVDTCLHCRSSVAPAQTAGRIQIEYPSFDAYRNLAQQAPLLQNFNRSVTLTTGSILGSVATPLTYINGDLNLTGDNLNINGLIYVTGDVLFAGRNISTLSGVTIVSAGEFKINGSAKDMNLRPYHETLGRYPLLDAENNVALMYTNKTGGNASVIDVSGSQNFVTGALMAPNGDVSFSGSSNIAVGAILGNTVNISGSSNRIEYDGSYFPPQPDRIELLQ